MAKPFGELIKHWPAERRGRVEVRTKELIKEEMTLRDLRRARQQTQVEMSRVLGVGQEQVSRLEKKSDMLLSTLTNYVRALGGDLQLTAAFPDRPPVRLTSLSDLSGDGEGLVKPSARRKGAARRVA